MGDEEGGEPVGLKAGASFWNFEFYQQFFDVESKQVGDRIIWSMVPKPGVSYLQSYIRPNPDLYGESERLKSSCNAFSNFHFDCYFLLCMLSSL